MSKYLSTLLDAKEPLFSNSLDQLAKFSGRRGADVALKNELRAKFYAHLEDIGLSFDDEDNGHAIYRAQLAKLEEQDIALAKSLGGKDPENVVEMLPILKKAVEESSVPKTAWAMKTNVAKKFIRNNPPTQIMKILGYNKVEDMLKKEDIFEIFGAIRFAEDEKWLNKFNETYKTLKPKDFTKREIKLIIMKKELWGDIAKDFVTKKRHNITHSKEMGAIMMLPMSIERMPGITLKVLPLLAHYFNEIRLYSTFFKLKSKSKNFGSVVVDVLNSSPDNDPLIINGVIHWRVIQRYYGKLLKDEKHPEIFEPHVQPEDLHWRKAEEILFELDKDLEMWRDMDYVGALMDDNRPIACNMMDVALGYSNSISYKERYIYHFRESLWNEIFIRFLGKKKLEEQILVLLDDESINPKKLRVRKKSKK